MTSPNIHLSLKTARHLAVVKQGLHQRPKNKDSQQLLKSIKQMGLLQLDSVNVVDRSHYLAMLSRIGHYDRANLDALLYPNRDLFEQWAHAACLIPTDDFAYFAPIILAKRDNEHWHRRLNSLGSNPQAVLDMVMDAIKERGALTSKDFDDPRPHRGKWWDHKPAKHALDMLYSRGFLMVDRREKFQIQYDLAERVLPEAIKAPTKTMVDYLYWATLQSVRCLGVATVSHASDYYRLKKSDIRTHLKTLQDEGKVTPVTVESWDGPAYVTTDDLALIEEIEVGKHPATITTFLTPFDNLTWNRDRLRELFNYHYQLEMYVPKAKRKYGYYVMPILHRGQYIGRIDPKVDRKTDTLLIQKLLLDEGIDVNDALIEDLTSALKELMVFNNCERIQVDYSEPKGLKRQLKGQLRRK